MVGRSPEPHSQVQAMLEGLNLPPRPALSVPGARAALNEVLVSEEPAESVADVSEYSIPVTDGEITLRAYRPDGAGPFPVLVYYHGGGWVRGNIDTHDDLCRAITNEAGCVVVSVDYRRAPEHSFPVPHEDAYAAAVWAVEYAEVIDGDPTRVAVGGDSAGGNLAASVALRARDSGGPSLCFQLLLYPITNHAFDTASYEENAKGYMLTRRGMEWYWDHYLERELDGRHPYASPLQARDLSDLPPALVITAGYDPLRDEGAAYAERLREAEVAVTHEHFEDMLHAFVSFPELDTAAEGRTLIAEGLRDALDLD
ncbi:MAG: alpha/beta hydrolase [Halobacteriales archaeon]